MTAHKPKILTFDIETRPVKGWFWRLFDENIGIEQIEDAGGPMCAAWKWLGQSKIHFSAEWSHKDKTKWLKDLRGAMLHADAIITQNGDRFDIPKVNGLLVLHNIEPLPKLTSIDVRKTVKKLGYVSTKLDFVTQYLKIGAKLKHEGFDLWKKVMRGEKQALRTMEKYNKHDVRLTELLYKRLAPYMNNHPYLGTTPRSACSNCGSEHMQSRGTRRTTAFIIKRLQCQSCGKWDDGKKTKVAYSAVRA
jgi:DNA polymerase elongation subunit (family B)